MRSVLNSELRRLMPCTSYPCCNKNSARKTPTRPNTPKNKTKKNKTHPMLGATRLVLTTPLHHEPQQRQAQQQTGHAAHRVPPPLRLCKDQLDRIEQHHETREGLRIPDLETGYLRKHHHEEDHEKVERRRGEALIARAAEGDDHRHRQQGELDVAHHRPSAGETRVLLVVV